MFLAGKTNILWKPGILFLLLLILAVSSAVMVWLKLENGSESNNHVDLIEERSVYNQGATGYRAWYLACKKANVLFEIWIRPVASLPVSANGQLQTYTMLMVKPYSVVRQETSFTPAEAQQVLSWVTQGNTLVLLDDFKRSGSHTIANHVQLSTELTDASGQKAFLPLTVSRQVSPRLQSFIKAPVQSRISRFFSVLPAHPQLKILLQNSRQQPVLIDLPYGKGHLILGTVTDLAENVVLNQPNQDNFQFLSNLLLQQNNPVLINEFVHGYQEQRNALNYYLSIPAVRLTLLQVGFLVLFFLWSGFSNWKPPLPPDSENQSEANLKEPQGGRAQKEEAQKNFRDAKLEAETLVSDIARLYQHHTACSLAVQPYLRRIEKHINKRYQWSLNNPEQRVRLAEYLAETASQQLMTDRTTSTLRGNCQQMLQTPKQVLTTLKQVQTLVQTDQKISAARLVELVNFLQIVTERLL
jgi:hypothetical protein